MKDAHCSDVRHLEMQKMQRQSIERTVTALNEAHRMGQLVVLATKQPDPGGGARTSRTVVDPKHPHRR